MKRILTFPFFLAFLLALPTHAEETTGLVDPGDMGDLLLPDEVLEL